MTNHWCDIKNSDCIIIVGSNAAENHPISFKWVTKAIEDNGATLISVDPRFTRSSAKADIYAKMRSGTDIAFFGGMIKWVLDDMEANPHLYNMTYVSEYTNAAFLIEPDFVLAADNDGKFSGLQVADDIPGVGQFGTYDKSTWRWQTDADGVPLKDKTLQNPNCVFQLLKRHYARYTPEMVCETTGTDLDIYLEICETYAHRTGPVGKSGTIMYAMGTTQHTHGTQNIRTYAMLQLLLGNIGVAGGGINALRGESNVQGSTDHCLLFHILPGYLKPPSASEATLQDHLDGRAAAFATSDPKSASWWLNYPKYFVSLLKSWYGENATAANDFGFEWLPKLDGNYSHISMFEAMAAGTIKGLFCWGQNPAVGGPNAFAERQALQNLEWLVAVDLWETETCAFWQEPGLDSSTIDTEVFLLPAAAFYEKDGSVVNSGRWSQWRYQAVDPPGDAMSDLDIINELMLEVISLYETESGALPEAVTSLRWKGWYDASPLPRGADSLTDLVSREINGWAETDILNDDGSVQYAEGTLMSTFGHLKDNGSTSSSNWLYTQSYTETEGEGVNAGEKNRQKWRDNTDYHPAGIGLYSKWSWCWPVNRRIIYNRASVDMDGNPWDENDFVIRWTGSGWEGDVPDGGWPPMNMDNTRYPFIMKPQGFARVFGPGLADGPFPEHYEPLESPIDNPFSGTQNNPAIRVWRPDEIADRNEYPIVCTTYRVTEHWQAGQMTRNLPWLVELMPQMFVEMSEELAEEMAIITGELVTVESLRGSVQATAIVTKRFKPFQLGSRTVHQIGLPWHWGFTGFCQGDSANNLSPHVGDANTMIPEYKAFLVRVTKGGV